MLTQPGLKKIIQKSMKDLLFQSTQNHTRAVQGCNCCDVLCSPVRDIIYERVYGNITSCNIPHLNMSNVCFLRDFYMH